MSLGYYGGNAGQLRSGSPIIKLWHYNGVYNRESFFDELLNALPAEWIQHCLTLSEYVAGPTSPPGARAATLNQIYLQPELSLRMVSPISEW